MPGGTVVILFNMPNASGDGGGGGYPFILGPFPTWYAPRVRTWKSPRFRTWQTPRVRTWKVHDMEDALKLYTKERNCPYEYDFSKDDVIKNGDVIQSATITVSPDSPTSGITVGGTSVGGAPNPGLVQVLLSGTDGSNKTAVPGTIYSVTCLASTVAGASIEAIMPIFVPA